MCSSDLYHHITVLGKENEACDHKYDITGSLCENNDKFAIDRMLPKIDMGDYLFIHDAGAEGKRATVSDMSGIVLHNDICSDVSVISVNRGVYVVKVNGKAIKVIVR